MAHPGKDRSAGGARPARGDLGHARPLHHPASARSFRTRPGRLAGQAGVDLAELDLGRDLTQCCGFGGLMENANPELAKKVIRDRAGQSGLDYLTYCAVCRELLAGAGKSGLVFIGPLLSRTGRNQPRGPSPHGLVGQAGEPGPAQGRAAAGFMAGGDARDGTTSPDQADHEPGGGPNAGAAAHPGRGRPEGHPWRPNRAARS